MQSAPRNISPNARASASKPSILLDYAIVFVYTLLALFTRIVTFAPLYALFAFPADSTFRYLALLCPVLIIFALLPLRFSFAQALVHARENRAFSLKEAYSFKGYGEKLGESVWHALHVFVWSLPLIVALIYAYVYQNTNDALTLLNAIRSLGATVVSLGGGIVTIFTSQATAPTGGIIEGFYALLAIAELGVLILLFGAMRNSAYRYLWVLASHDEKNPHVEARRRLRGRRLKQLAVAAINLVLWIPFLYALALIVGRAFSDVTVILSTALMSQSFDTSALTALMKPTLIAFLALYLPILPVRRFITAHFAASCHTGNGLTRGVAKAPLTAPSVRNWMDDVPTTSSGSPAPEVESPKQQSKA